MNITGANIARLRKSKGWTQEQFVARLNVEGWDISRGTYAKIESQIRQITDVELQIIAKILRVSIKKLFESNDSNK